MTLINGIEHVAICARDTRRLADFYANVLGFRVVYDNGKTPPTFFVKAPDGQMIEIMPAGEKPATQREPNDPGIIHLALAVADLDAAMAELAGRFDVRFEGPIKASGQTRAVFFRDPEGNILHLIQRPAPL